MSDAGKPVCDFCSKPAVRWEYPARDFAIGVIGIDDAGKTDATGWGSEGSWGACEECHKIIETGDHAALLRRSVESSKEIAVMPELREPLTLSIAMIHERFFESRTGPARPAAEA